jgi:ankyrin repeat protein
MSDSRGISDQKIESDSSDIVSRLENNFRIFLASIGESYPKFALNWICSGVTFMNFRADFLDEEDKNIERMNKIASYSIPKMHTLGILYYEYKNTRRQTKAVDSKSIIRKFTADELDEIHFAEEVYYYLHSALAAFNPTNVNLYINKKSVNQDDFIGALEFIDDKKQADQVKQVFSVSFVFRENELQKLFEHVVYPGDYIRLGSGTHAIYLSYKKGQWILYDPDPIKIDCEKIDIVTLLKERFFLRFDRKTEYIPLSMQIYNKMPIEELNTRPDAVILLKEMLAERKEIDQGVNQRAWNGTTSLHMVARTGNVAVLKMLIKEKADVNTVANDEWTPLGLAALNGHAAVITVLAEANVNLNAGDRQGWTAAMIAAKNCHPEVIRTLAEAKADLNAVNKDGETAAMIAAKNGYSEVIRALAEAKADLNAVNKDGETGAMIAAKNGYSEVIRALADAKADLNTANKYGETAVMIAAENGHSKVIEALSEAKANLNAMGNFFGLTATMIAAKKGNHKVLAALVEAKADLNAVDIRGWTAAMIAAQKGNSAVIRALSKSNNVNLNACDENGWTAAMIAAKKGDAGVIRALADAKADLNTINKNGETAAMIAAKNGHTTVITALTEAETNLKAVNKIENDILPIVHPLEVKKFSGSIISKVISFFSPKKTITPFQISVSDAKKSFDSQQSSKAENPKYDVDGIKIKGRR